MPIVTVNLWYDRPVMTEAFVGLPGRTMQWVFDKRIAFGGTRLAPVAGLERRHRHRRRRPTRRWSALAAREVEASLPGARGVWPVRATVDPREAGDVLARARPAGAPGHADAVAGLFLAGDWTDTGLPATIEGAVVSGHRAAAASWSDVNSKPDSNCQGGRRREWTEDDQQLVATISPSAASDSRWESELRSE